MGWACGMIQFKKLTKDAKKPEKAHPSDAGYDLFCNEDILLTNGGRRVVSTGICIAIPDGYYGRIAPKSGLAAKDGIDVLGGVVDSGYRGEIKVILINTDRLSGFKFHKGDKIAQLILEQCFDDELFEVEEFVGKTDRDKDGFGSTGN